MRSAIKLAGLAFLRFLVLSASTMFGWAQADAELRIIVVDTLSVAMEVQDGIVRGQSFDRLAREHSLDPSGATGGYMGAVVVGDLRPEFQEALEGLAPGELSAPTPLDDSFLIVQLLGERDTTWIERNQDGFTAFREARYPEAIEALSDAVDAAEQLEPDRLAQSLANLADVYRLRGEYEDAVPLYERAVALYEDVLGLDHPDLALTLNNQALLFHALGEYARADTLYTRALTIWEQTLGPGHLNVAAALNNLGVVRQSRGALDEAEALLRRALEIRERNLGPDHSDVAQSLGSLGDLHLAMGDFSAAEEFFSRALEIFEQTLGEDHPTTVASRTALGETLVQQTLERFAELVSLSAFRDEEYEAVRATFARSLMRAPVAEETYLEMADIFVREDMVAEAESMLREAAERFESREAYYHLGEQLLDSGAVDAALEAFQRASVTPGPPDIDPVVEAQMRSFVWRRIGDLHGDAGRYDEAIEAYSRAFEIDPEIVEARLGRGVVFFRSGRPEEAVAEYRWVVETDPENVAALTRLSETLNVLGRFEESAAVALKALDVDPDLSAARYLRGRALAALGQVEEGRRLIDEYKVAEADRLAGEQRTREVIALDRAAMARILEGEYEEGLRLYQEAIEKLPETPQFYFRLGVAQNKLGKHADAIDTFLKLIDLGLGDDFVVHKNLAEAYRALGDVDASARHQSLYLAKRAAEMALD